MEIFGNVLFIAGLTGLLVGYFWALSLAFKKSRVFGIACILVNLLLAYFLMTNPRTTWRPGLLLLVSFLAAIAGYQMGKF